VDEQTVYGGPVRETSSAIGNEVSEGDQMLFDVHDVRAERLLYAATRQTYKFGAMGLQTGGRTDLTWSPDALQFGMSRLQPSLAAAVQTGPQASLC
jgi:hypothetical protein